MNLIFFSKCDKILWTFEKCKKKIEKIFLVLVIMAFEAVAGT